MKGIRLAIFLAIKDMLNNVGSLVFVSAALGFLFANVLFSRFMLYGFETVIKGLVPKVSGHLYVSPPRGKPYLYDARQTLAEIRNKDLIQSLGPVLEMPCVLDYKGNRIVTIVWGIDFDEQVMSLKSHIVSGSYFSSPYADEIILGKVLKERFEQKIPKDKRIDVGDTPEAIFIKEHNIDKFNRDVYRAKYCKIAGVADFRDYVANNNIFMPIEALRSSVILNNRASSIFVRLKDNVELDEISLESFKPSGREVQIKHWKDRDDYGTDDLVNGFNVISIITFGVSIICAAILVAFVIYFSTQKKRRTIGILRAIGIKGRIFLIFFILEGVLFSIIGVTSGTVIYYALESYLREHPIVMPFGNLYPIFEINSYILASALFLAVSFAASVYYAVKSGKENIVKIIRGD